MLEARARLLHLLQLRCKELDGVQVYGYISNTRIKFLLVLNEQASREDEIRLVRPLHCCTPIADSLHCCNSRLCVTCCYTNAFSASSTRMVLSHTSAAATCL